MHMQREWRNSFGQYHRVDGPAVAHENGYKAWYINNKRHRVDGPAIIFSNGDQEWYLNGERHREDGPAYVSANGLKSWWINGQCHRVDGPAVIFGDGSEAWYINDCKIETVALEDWMKEYQIPTDYTKWSALHQTLLRLSF